ncbi:hypothetical protein C8F04DRAFT_1249405 [Mycena alexandri]|uniref:Methyltransferase domain-containing protein n=1 Tax=Mycena alexandri TaxID=1745969 RepID=A0AAD6TIP7_9AGAR|nr:hypothetical protein C8F04DRAFT_1249405 [Mycena alexandri]
MDVHLHPQQAQSLRPTTPDPHPHYRLSRLHPPPNGPSLRPPSIISRSVSAGMTFGFKKDKDKEKDKDNNKNPRAPSPDDRPPPSTASRFAFGLRKKVSLVSLRQSSSQSHADDTAISRTTSASSGGGSSLGHHSVPPIEETPASPIEPEEAYESDADEDVHAPDRFVKKNAWRTRHKMKLHPYPDVPYMQAYDPVVLENERYTHYLLRRLAPAGSPTFHDYGAHPPASVLDLGCGSGVWLLDAARTWRATQFIGLDLVDVALPALAASSASSNSPTTSSTAFPFPPAISNVRLVRSDFLKYALPFPDRQFELVRMANLALAIPRARMEFVLKEVRRVLAPGGRLELVDDQTLFAYGDPPVEEALEFASDGELEMDVEAEPLAHTPTALALPQPPSSSQPLLSPSTPRAPPPTPDTSGFFDDASDSSSDLDETESRSSESAPGSDDLLRPASASASDCASERSSGSFSFDAESSFDAASTLVGSDSAPSERGSVELTKKPCLAQPCVDGPVAVVRAPSGAPQLDLAFDSEVFRMGHARGFSGVEHLVIEIPPVGEALGVVDRDVGTEGETPVTPVPPRGSPSHGHGHVYSASTDSSVSSDSTDSAPSTASSVSTATSSAPPTPSADALPEDIRMLLAPPKSPDASAPPASYSQPQPHQHQQRAPAPETSAGPWTTARAAALDMERLFARMCATRYGLPPPMRGAGPGGVAGMMGVLQRVFGEPPRAIANNVKVNSKAERLMGVERGRVERPASMHLKLAPVGVEGREGVVVRGGLTAGGSARDTGAGAGWVPQGREGVRAWMTSVEWDESPASTPGASTSGGVGSVGGHGKAGRAPAPVWAPAALPKGISAKAAERLGIAPGGGAAGATSPAKRVLPSAVMESPEGSEDDFDEEEEEEPVVGLRSGAVEHKRSDSVDFWDDGDEEELDVSPVEKGRGASTWVPPSEWDAPPVPVLSREHSSSGIPTLASDRTITAASSSRTITSTKPVKQLGFATKPTPSLSLPPTPTASLHSRDSGSSQAAQTHTRGTSTASTASARSTASAISTASTSSSASSGAYSASFPEPGAPPRFSSARVQHPGLILWPATFIPVPPRELEMHATKHVQTVLGCKPALAEFVGEFVDGEGRRVVSEEEFEDAVWGYECFRRPRFNWPELPEDRLEGDDLFGDLSTPVSARSAHHVVPPRTPTGGDAPRGSKDPHPFAPDELTHVRTVRVFAAVKGGVVRS